MRGTWLLLVSIFLVVSPDGVASPPLPEGWTDALQWRSIGPYRGGRSTAVAGVPGAPERYYFGASGGGLWRSDDGKAK